MEEHISPQAAEVIRIIYGGSITENNVVDYLDQENIDGFLVTSVEL